MKRVIGGLLFVHILLVIVAIASMCMTQRHPLIADIHNNLIDGYEAIGFGMFAVGMGIVTAVLGGLWLWVRRQ